MLKDHQLRKIWELRETTTLSLVQIAAKVGISRSTVKSVIRDKRRPEEGKAVKEIPIELPSGPPSRCSTCGYMVQKPCHFCQIEARKNRQRLVTKIRQDRESTDGRIRTSFNGRVN